jgi:dTDP-4-dehydrorhamnose reductase
MTTLPRTIVIGAAGQVGSALIEELGQTGIGITRREANIANREELLSALNNAGPASALVNAAAYTDVERAESNRDLAFAVNADAPGWAAEWAAARQIPYVHFSTDYVFADRNDKPWHESDQTAPLNVYGESKRAGEIAVQRAHPEGVIIRTSWVYSDHPNNFVRKVLRLAMTGPSLTVVADQVGIPTFAPALSHAALRIVEDGALRSRIQGGVIHLASGTVINRADFARAIIAAGVAESVLPHVVPVVDTTSDGDVSVARRPLHCVLDVAQSHALGIQLAPWQESLPFAVRAAHQ